MSGCSIDGQRRWALSVLAALVVAGHGAHAGSSPTPSLLKLVSSADGRPVPGVAVRIGGRHATTAADGSATLDGLASGQLPLAVLSPAFEAVSRKIDVPAGRRDPIELRLTPVVTVIQPGRVVMVGTGEPVAGARVTLTPHGVKASVHGPYTFTTGWDGRFQALEVPTGEYRAQVQAAGCEAATFTLAVASPPGPAEWTLARVSAAAAITVQVRDSVSGSPVSGARVVLAEAGTVARIAEAMTDGGGSCRLEGRTGRLNRADGAGHLAIGRRSVTLLVTANGHTPGLANGLMGATQPVEVLLDPTAAIDAQEPDDSPASARRIAMGAPVKLAIEKNGDADFFRFRLRHAGAVDVQVGPDSEIETLVRLRASDGSVIRERGMGPHGLNLIQAGGLPAGEYLVEVREWGDNGSSPKPMTLRVTTDPAPDAMEPNDQASQARLIATGEEVRGSILPLRDVDWYRFEVKRPGHVRVTMPPHPLERLVALRNQAGQTVRDAGMGGNGHLEFVAQVSPGWYTLDVHEWGDNGESTVPYTLRLEEIADDGIDDPAPAEGRMSAVRELPLFSLAGGTIFPVGDVDVYEVSVPSAGRLRMQAIAPIEHLLTVRDTPGRVLAEVGMGPGGWSDRSVDLDGPATLFLVIREWGDNGCSTDPYVLRTWFEPCDELEVNDRDETPETAVPVELSQPIRGSVLPVRDVDAYQLEVDHPGWLSIQGQGPVELLSVVKDVKRRTLIERGTGPGQPIDFACPVLPGTYFLVMREWGDNGTCLDAYAVAPALRRAEPQERAPLAGDPVRTLAPGEAQAYWIDQIGDRDRFSMTTAGAGKHAVSVWAPLETLIRVFDDRTGALVLERGIGPRSLSVVELDAKGPTRYRLELTEWGDNGVSSGPGFVLFDRSPREVPCEWIRAAADPVEPTRVTFTREAIEGRKGGTSVKIDADGDGHVDLTVSGPAGEHRYASEGIQTAVAWIEGASGVRTRVPLWVEATGAHERRGVRVVVDHPSQGKLVEREAPVRARAISYTGARVARVDFAVDGKPAGSSFTPPFELDLPWTALEPGEHELSVTATDASGESARIDRKFRLSDYFGLAPEDGAVVSGEAARVSWSAAAFGPATLNVREKGAQGWTEVRGEDGRARVVTLSSLEPGKAYEVQPQGGAEPGPIRTITRVKGLAFGKPRYGANIKRDYDQRVGVSVRNHGDKPLTVRLECGKPESPLLLAGFVGEGSEGAPFPLGPGEEREFWLGLSAQDVVTPVHRFPVRLVSDDGLSDQAEVEATVKLPEVKLRFETLGPAPHGLGTRFRLHNEGDPLTDLSVTADRPDVTVSPSVRHGLLPAGSSLDFLASPVLAEGFTGLEAKLIARAVDRAVEQPFRVALAPGESLHRVLLTPGGAAATAAELEAAIQRSRTAAALDPAKVDWSSRSEPLDTDGDGRADRWSVTGPDAVRWVGNDTDGDGQVDFVHADVGSDGTFELSALKTKDVWTPTNLVEATLEMGFTLPWARSAYEKHDVDVVVNGRVVGRLRDTIPDGTYTFRIPPDAVKFNEDGTPGDNRVSIQSKHLRGGHYVVNSDFRLKFRLTATPLWVPAKSAGEAAERARHVEGLALSGPDFTVSASQLRVAGPDPIPRDTPVGFEVPVRNLGATSPRTVAVALMEANPGGADTELDRIELPAPELTGSALARLRWVARAGAHRLKIVVDPARVTGDTDLRNNEAAVAVSVSGDAAPPSVILTGPADLTALTSPVAVIRARVTGSAGTHLEGKVDQGMWTALGGAGDHEVRCLVQPGSHQIDLRATDAGKVALVPVRVKVDSPLPEARLLAPAPGSEIATSVVEVQLEAPADAVLVAARAGDGPWRRAQRSGALATVRLPVRFGPQVVQARVAAASGAVRDLTVNVTSTRQPRPDDSPPDREPAQTGTVAVAGLGAVDLFGPTSVLIAAGAASATAPTTPVADRLTPTGRAVYRALSEPRFLVAEFDGKSVKARCVAADGAMQFRFDGPLGPDGTYVGSAAITGATTAASLDYAFDPAGNTANTDWTSPEGGASWPSLWMRVKDVGSTEPAPGQEGAR